MLDLILVTVISFMIHQTTKASVIELKRWKTMLPLKLQVLLEDHHKPKSTGNLGLNHLNS